MPRDLFGQMTRPFDGVGARSRLTVPVSLAAHVLAVAAVVVVPLLASDALPALRSSLSVSMITPVVPPPPPPLRRIAPRASETPAVRPDAAPLDAPEGFSKEPDLVPVEAGSPDLGVIPGEITSADALTPPPVARVEQPPPAIVRPGGNIQPPTKVRDAAPIYPPIAQVAGVQGVVIIEAVIGVDGEVIDARILRSRPLLDEAALTAVRQWRYTPTRLNGMPVAVIMTVTVNFQLR
jgi:periplasmic protein TonB